MGSQAVACHACALVSPKETDSCPECGQALSPVARVFSRYADAGHPPRWLLQARQQAGPLRSAETARSDQRMQFFLELEERPVAHLQEAEGEQSTNDRRVLLARLAHTSLFIVCAAAVILSELISP